jgi:hypothetical protein
MSLIGVILIVLVLLTIVIDIGSEVWLRGFRQRQDRRSAVQRKSIPGRRAHRDKHPPADSAQQPVLGTVETAAISPELRDGQTEEILV